MLEYMLIFFYFTINDLFPIYSFGKCDEMCVKLMIEPPPTSFSGVQPKETWLELYLLGPSSLAFSWKKHNVLAWKILHPFLVQMKG